MPDDPPRYRVLLVLEPVRGWAGPPPDRRLAALLRAAKRAYGFKCVRVEDAPAGGGEGKRDG